MLRSRSSVLLCSSSSSFIKSPLKSSSSSATRTTQQKARRKWEENLSDFLSERNESRSEVLRGRYRDIYVHKDFTPVQEVFPTASHYESKKWGNNSSNNNNQNQQKHNKPDDNQRKHSSLGKKLKPIFSPERQAQNNNSNTNANNNISPETKKRRDEFMKRVDKVNRDMGATDSLEDEDLENDFYSSSNANNNNNNNNNPSSSIYLRSQNIETPHVARVALIGPTNAGKSTLLNTLVASHISAESRRPGTTVDWVKGVTHVHDTQIQLLDTPGIFLPRKRGSNLFSKQLPLTLAAWDSLFFANVVVFCNPVGGGGFLDPGRKQALQELARRCKARELPIVLAMTKVDLVGREKQRMLYRHLRADIDTLDIPFAETCEVSAPSYKGIVDLKDILASFALPGQWEFPKNEVTGNSMNLSNRVEETLREVFFQMLPHEIPAEMSHKVVGWTIGDDKNGNKVTKIIVECFFGKTAFMHEFFKHQLQIAQRSRERCKVVLKQNVWFHFQAFVSPAGKNRV